LLFDSGRDVDAPVFVVLVRPCNGLEVCTTLVCVACVTRFGGFVNVGFGWVKSEIGCLKSVRFVVVWCLCSVCSDMLYGRIEIDVAAFVRGGFGAMSICCVEVIRFFEVDDVNCRFWLCKIV
jgi:hypothetical protein